MGDQFCRDNFSYDGDEGLRISDHDMVFWMGDLNYRIEGLPNDIIKTRLLSEQGIESLKEYDQLRLQRNLGNVFAGIIDFFTNLRKYKSLEEFMCAKLRLFCTCFQQNAFFTSSKHWFFGGGPVSILRYIPEVLRLLGYLWKWPPGTIAKCAQNTISTKWLGGCSQQWGGWKMISQTQRKLTWASLDGH